MNLLSTIVAVTALLATDVDASNIRVGKKCPEPAAFMESVNSFVKPKGRYSVGKKWNCLRSYIQCRSAGENTEFLEKYTEMTMTKDKTERSNLAKQIYEIFLVEDDDDSSPFGSVDQDSKTINVDSGTRTEIEAQTCFAKDSEEDCPADVFDRAAKDIRNLIDVNFSSQFVKDLKNFDEVFKHKDFRNAIKPCARYAKCT